jgi:regulator of sigma E protease
MSESKRLLNKNLQGILWLLVFAAAIYLIVQHIGVFSNVLLVLIGFGAVVIVHEFGHFIIAKLSDIKVEAFSIFMPPTLLGIRKTKDGFQFRFLPKLFSKEDDEPDEPQATSDEPQVTRVGETEYRIGLIPFGGFVKMLGQDDTSPVKSSDDSRSFANKPIRTRIAVIAAGVTFNVISAVIIFMIIFLIGINLPPAVVGEVVPNSPAARAGLKPGDEVIEIASKTKDLDFSNILIAAALSGEGEKVPLRVRHKDGSEEDFALVAEQLPGKPMRNFGIEPPVDLTIAEISDPNALLKKTGLLPGDRIKAVNGRDVQNYWELEEIVENTFAPEVTLLAERTNKTGESRLVESKIKLEMILGGTTNIYSMVPRFRMEDVKITESTWMKITAKMRRLLEKIGIKESLKKKPFLQSGDIILSVSKVKCPSSEEFSDTVKKCEDNELPINVLRTDANGVERQHTINVKLKRDPKTNETRIGISYFRMFDFEHPVVAQTVAVEGGPPKLEIPRGAVITAVDGKKVSNFYDIIRDIRQHAGERVKIDYLDGQTPNSVVLDVSGYKNPVTFKSTFAEYIPFKPLEILYRATGPIQAVTMGYRRTIMFIAQTYLTIKRLISGVISPKLLSGPVGIIAFSYRIVAEQPLVYYVYFLGLISAAIAVFNLLPLPPLDGGLIVLMLIERIKGSALSERTQGVIAYTGWAIIGTLILYVTFNDIVRNFFS